MKVLQINAVYGVGSTGIIVEDLHTLSQKEGIESYVAYSTAIRTNITNSYVIGTVFEKKFHAAMTRLTGKQGYYSLTATNKLVNYINTLKPDIVHLHNLHSNYIHLNTLLSYLAKNNIPTVLTLHDCWFYTGGCFHYTSVNCNKWKSKCGKCPKKKGDSISYLFDSSSQILIDRKKFFGNIKQLYVVGVSQWIENECRESVLKPMLFTHIYNGIDTDFFKPVKSDFRSIYGIENQFLILGMANKFFLPINKKSLNTIVDSLQDDEKLIIIGCSAEQIKKLPPAVLGLPYIHDRRKLREVYASCDVFVNCTREESLSLVNIEVQACGTPVVTYSNTGVKETVDGISSYAVENGNPEEILKKLRLIRNSDYQKRSQKCIEWVKDNFEIHTNYRKYIELYRMIDSKAAK